MKDSIADVWLLGLIVVFILMFASYIAITVSYTASFKLKNEVLNIIERHKGMTDKVAECNVKSTIGGGTVCANMGAYQTVNLYLLGNAYTAKGNCPNDGDHWYGVKELEYETMASSFEEAKESEKYYYCFAYYDTGRLKNSNATNSKLSSVYYKVRLFYKFEFPVLTEFLSVRVDGMTDEIYNPATPVSITKNSAVFTE